MPGFYVSNRYALTKFDDIDYYEYVENSIEDNQYYIYRKVINKFLNDKVIFDSDCYSVLSDGVLLNKNTLQSASNIGCMHDLLISLYEEKHYDFPSILRGSFSGCLHDKRNNEWYFYTNQTGTKPLFYYIDGGAWIVSSSLCYIAESLKENGKKITLNRNSVYNLVSYGFMIGQDTMISEVHKLLPGHGLIINENGIKIVEYYRLDNTPDTQLSINEIIDKMDSVITRAIDLEYAKDKEYGYSHLAQLSGGLDSRCALWIANKKLGYEDITSYCFSQSQALDQIISQKIASDLGIEYLFKNLDDALFITKLEDSIYMNYGLCCSSGQLHWMPFDRIIGSGVFGLRHTGQLGGTVAGSYSKDENGYNKIDKPLGYNSTFLLHKTHNDFSKYANQELFLLSQRGFNGILCSDFIADTSSPFLDVDVLDFCLKIPLNIRQKENGIYKKLLLERYPEACVYKWEKTNNYLNASKLSVYLSKVGKYGIKTSLALVLNKVFHTSFEISFDKNWMNPYDLWYKKNEKLRHFMDSYLNENICNSIIDDELKADLLDMYSNTSAREKLQVLTALMAIKYFWA